MRQHLLEASVINRRVLFSGLNLTAAGFGVVLF